MQRDTYTITVNKKGSEEVKEVEVIRVDNDVNGNPRYVIHFLDINEDYDNALKQVRKIGGRVYRAKWFSDGFVFQSYNVRDTLERLFKEEE